MKFKIRDSMVVHLVTLVDLGDGKTQPQEASFYGGQTVDLTAEQAADHAHKLEPASSGTGKSATVDKDAEAFLAGYVAAPSAPAGISPEQLALVQAVAAETAKAVAAALAAPVTGTAAAPAPSAS